MERGIRMYVKVYLEDKELLKFLAGQPCQGYFVSFTESHQYSEVLVPRDRVQAEASGSFFGPGLIARITG